MQKRFVSILVSILLSSFLLTSCKKGEEDPFLSFYSRKHRLCQDWKFSYFKKVEQHNDSIVSWEYDGVSILKLGGNQMNVSAADMKISIKKDGSYVWDETITSDTSVFLYKETGSWYFSGGGSASDTKNKELLTLQKNNVTQTLQAGGTTTTSNYYGTGDLDATVYNIIKLSSKEVSLKSEITVNDIQSNPYISDLKITNIEIRLERTH